MAIVAYPPPIHKRSRIPVTWIRAPQFRGDSQNCRNDCPELQSFRWMQWPGYVRVRSWDQMNWRDRAYFARLGHNRETWDNGYVRKFGIDTGLLRVRDRVGRLVITKINRKADLCTVQCDCGSDPQIIPLGRLEFGSKLSCGVSCPMWLSLKSQDEAA